MPDNVLARGHLKCGDVQAGHAHAVATAEGSFETAFVEHAYIEPEAGYAVPIGEGPDRIEVTACTQAPYMDREETARVLGVDQSRVRIRPSACGGGFGGKLDVSVQPLVAVAAWATRRPVRIVYTRTESMVSTTKRHPAHIWAKSSADRQGRLTAFEMQADFNTGAYASWGPTVASRVPVHGMGPYRVPNASLRTRAVYTNDTPAGAFRGFGVPQAAIAHETLMDDLAEQLGLERWAIRRINAFGHGDATPSGQVLRHSAGLPKCLDALKPDWEAALERAASHNAGAPRRRRGVGIACMWYGCGNTGVPNPSAMRIALARDGTLTFFNGAVDIGQGSSTVLVQIAADALGLPPHAFRLVVGDTDLTEDAGKTSASRQTFVSGNAARLAAEDLRRKILALANAGPHAKLTLAGARLSIVDGEASREIDLATINSPAEGDGSSVAQTQRGCDPHGVGSSLRPTRPTDDLVLEGVGSWDPPTTPLDANGQGVPYATYGFAAQMAEVEVDTVLGTTKVVEIVAAHDVGRAINPTLVEGQIHGGIAQGLGMALMEEYIPGRTENLHDYLIPTAGDMPPIKTYLIEDAELDGPFGAKGVGEPALIATAPAILSAIRHATGARMHPRAGAAPPPVGSAAEDAYRIRTMRDPAPRRGSRSAVRHGQRRRPPSPQRESGPHEQGPARSPRARRNSAPPRARGSCAATPARCCAASGRAAPAPARATPTRMASWCAPTRSSADAAHAGRGRQARAVRRLANGTARRSIRRARSSPASAPAPPIPTTSRRPSSSRPSTRASIPSPS